MLSDIHYDPRDDLWYKKAYDNPNRYIFIDMVGDGNSSSYITMSKVFHQSSNGSISGVAAADISRRQFSVIIRNLLTSCSHCYVLDDNGYVLEQSNSRSSFQSRHLTEVAGPVSFVLVKKGILKPVVCMDDTSGEKKLTYTLDISGPWPVVRQTGCHDFILTSINNTNLFLLEYKPDSCMSVDIGSCSCQEKCLQCDEKIVSVCQCPCTCINRTLDDCNTNFTLAQGYTPCRDKQRHWKTVKNLNIQRSNITECLPQCPSLTTEKDCSKIPGCTWCTTGIYKYIPICTQNCIIDRLEFNLMAPCSNLTIHNIQVITRATQTAVRNRINNTNIDISQPQILQKNVISFNVSSKDGTVLPDRLENLFSRPLTLNISDNIVLVDKKHVDKFVGLRIVLTFDNVNFTEELETELTLRGYLETQVNELIYEALTDRTAVIHEIWPEQNKVSVYLATPTAATKNLWIQQLGTVNITTLTSIDLFGRRLNLLNVSLGNMFNSLCDADCDKRFNHDDCNRVSGCHWDIYSNGICSNNSFLPERIQTMVYLPCFGLYTNLTEPDNKIIRKFKAMLVSLVPTLHSDMMKISLEKNDMLIGRQVMLELQGRMSSPPVTDIWSDIQQLLVHNTSINRTEYYTTLQPVTYQQFTNMHITLTIEGINVDHLLQQHPLDGREEIKQGITNMVKLYLRPQVVRTIGNWKISQDGVTFSVENYHNHAIDLRSEYDMLQTAVTNNRVKVTVYNHRYKVKDVYFIGSFDELCPRSCDDGTQSTCDSIPGCDWSDLGQCLSDIVYPERMNVTVYFPCLNFQNLTDFEKRLILTKTEEHITSYQRTRTHSDIVNAVILEEFSGNIVVTLQASSKSPTLASLYKETWQWLIDNKLHIKLNNSTVTGISDQDFTSISVSVEFTNINFTTETLEHRILMIKEMSSRIKLVLDEGVTIDNVWLTSNYGLFDISRNNSKSAIDLRKEVKKIKKFIELGGLTFKSYTVKPNEIYTHGYIDCKLCDLDHQTETCKMQKDCFWHGEWNTKFCDLKNPDNYTYEIALPCNQTQTLTTTEKMESVKSLQDKVLQVLLSAGLYVVHTIDITETGASIELQTTPSYPYLERYVQLLKEGLDFRTGFNFGSQHGSKRFLQRHPNDYTNILVELHFKSIDFDAIVNSGLATYQDIATILHQQINSVVLAEIAESVHVEKIEKDYIQFSVKKIFDSHAHLPREITKLKTKVDNGKLQIDINYIRPVIATAMIVDGSFDELCKHLALQITGPTISSLPTIASNVTVPQIPMAMFPIPPIIVVYNKTTASQQNLQTIIDSTYVDVCYVEVQQCPLSFSWQHCSFKQPLPDNKVTTNDPDHVGPVQWTIISVGGVFILALALWAVQGIHEMLKKKKPEQKSNGGSSIEEIE